LKLHSVEKETIKLSQMKVEKQISITSISLFLTSEFTGSNLFRFVLLQYVWKFPLSKSNFIIILQKLLDSVKLTWTLS